MPHGMAWVTQAVFSQTRLLPLDKRSRGMRQQIISLDDWWSTPQGRHALDWEQRRFQEATVDVFGFNAVQLGVSALHGLDSNRMPHRWLVGMHQVADRGEALVDDTVRQGCQMVCDPAALPFAEQSLDLILLPHTLEQSAHPHGALREVERVLRPEGRVVISGLNPLSLWATRQRRSHLLARLGLQGLSDRALYLPRSGEFISHWRIKDWLALLGFEVTAVRFGVYAPAVQSEKWLSRYDWMERHGARWWPVLGAVYTVEAVKRVRGMRLLGPAWKPFRSRALATGVVAGYHTPSQFKDVGAPVPDTQSKKAKDV